MKNDTTEKKIEGIINRHISPKINWSQFKFLGDLGIDEISLEKGKGAYMTIITARINGKVRILSIIKGRKKRDIKIERYFVCKNQLQYLEKPLKF